MRVEVNLQGLYGLETIHGVFFGECRFITWSVSGYKLPT